MFGDEEELDELLRELEKRGKETHWFVGMNSFFVFVLLPLAFRISKTVFIKRTKMYSTTPSILKGRYFRRIVEFFPYC